MEKYGNQAAPDPNLLKNQVESHRAQAVVHEHGVIDSSPNAIEMY